MAASPLTLAKKIKALIANHPTLVERDGNQHLPPCFNFNFGGELEKAGKKLREGALVKIGVALYDSMRELAQSLPDAEDTSREATKVRNALQAYRAIYTLVNSANGILRTRYEIRTIGVDEIGGVLNMSNTQLTNIEELLGVFQFKRHDTDENNPWVYSWILTVDGVSVSRGAKQPIHKLVSSLLKLIDIPENAVSAVNESIAQLAKLKAGGTPYYWFLSNTDTAMWYQAFSNYLSLSSCMSKSRDYYSHTGPRQHPMDCYDNSPDWSLMLLTDKSPEDIIAMCDLVIANPGDAAELFKFPWLSRSLVLPTNKEISGKTINAPYVMGKFYGNDKLVEFFYNDSEKNAPYVKNDNPLLAGSYTIEGGRINAIKSTRNGYESTYLLPYFDRVNLARLVKEGDNTWWISSSSDYGDNSHRDPIARGIYDAGSASFKSFYSPAYGGYTGINTRVLNTFDTLYGPELEDYRSNYEEHQVGGSTQLIPSSMFVDVNGERVLKGQVAVLYDGSSVTTTAIAANPTRYQLVEGFGIFDMDRPSHVETHNRLMGE